MNKARVVGLDVGAERRAFKKNEKDDNNGSDSCQPHESVAEPSMRASYLAGDTQEEKTDRDSDPSDANNEDQETSFKQLEISWLDSFYTLVHIGIGTYSMSIAVVLGSGARIIGVVSSLRYDVRSRHRPVCEYQENDYVSGEEDLGKQA